MLYADVDSSFDKIEDATPETDGFFAVRLSQAEKAAMDKLGDRLESVASRVGLA
jgi:hypothetical protein